MSNRRILVDIDYFLELDQKAKLLKQILEKYPEVLNNKKPRKTKLSKKYKEALGNLVSKVEEVNTHPRMISVFAVAALHGQEYDGPTYAEALKEAKKLLND